MINIIFALLCSYLLGSIPNGYLLVKLLKGIDIRKYGSGNIGATNVMRVIGKGPGITVLLLDAAKGFLAVTVLAAVFYRQELPININILKILMGAFVIFGHNWTIFLGFKGGKGVATSAGVLLGFSPVVMIAAALVWVALVLITRYVSVSSILAAIAVPILMLVLNKPKEFFILTALMCPVIIYRHKSNIARLMQGKEPKIWGRLKKENPSS